MKKYLKITMVCILLVGFLAGCTNKNENKKKQKNTKEAVQLMSPSELTTLNTSVLLDFPDAIVQTAAFEGLYSLDEQDQLVPAVAKALPMISEDGKTYTISLRKEAVWSNDDPVTAHDFEYAWKKMIDPKNGFVYSFLIVETIQNGAEISAGKLAPNELGVTAVDDYTLKVTLKEPKPYFTSLLAFPTFFPQNQKVVEQFGADYGTASDKVVYNGPFVVKDWPQTKLDWQLSKNNRY
ncbi:ABC transporter substrate-binding protein, partial [Enterococcus faecalis]|uniref:ABC transporter substrate-binding protein n=1 Tax=Enterococcus faecalis TaxID=1351 RepID=UPI003D351D48